jgi:hypothetical protein
VVSLWYKDPYGEHDDRWFSDGEPTSSVRDGGTESHDSAPDSLLPTKLVRCETADQVANGSDLRRADDAERDTASDSEGGRSDTRQRDALGS